MNNVGPMFDFQKGLALKLYLHLLTKKGVLVNNKVRPPLKTQEKDFQDIYVVEFDSLPLSCFPSKPGH